MDFVKIRAFFPLTDTVKKMKWQVTPGRKCSDKGLVSRIYLKKKNPIRKQTNLLKHVEETPTVPKIRYTNGQEAHEKIFSILIHKGNTVCIFLSLYSLECNVS